jgi:glycosyltransferase involved in cell wall biosynthesis
MTLPTFSVAIETANLSVADLDGLRVTLDALSAQTVPVTRANEVLLTDSGDVPAGVLDELLHDFPWVRALRLPRGTGYEELKMAAVVATTGDVIVYADGDCYYDPIWLQALLEPFADPSVAVVAGETSIDSSGPYGLAMAITFSFSASTSSGLYRSDRYHFNNVAFRRRVLQNTPVPTRRPCYRMTGLHAAMLQAAGHPIWREPRARARHAAPNGFTHFVWRFLLFGHDGVVVPRLVAADARAAGRPPTRTRHTLALAWRWASQAAKKLAGELRRTPSRAPELILVAPIVVVAVALQAAGAVAGLIASPQLLAAMPEDILRASTCEPGVPARQVAPGG